MEKYIENLSATKFPVYILIKNLEFEHKEDLDAPISRGEIIGNSIDFATIKKMVPIPNIPDDDYKLSLYEEKYGDANVVKPEFDDSPMDISVGDPTDYEIFGTSYTIIWFTTSEEDDVIDILLKEYSKSRNLISIWDNFIDRMHVFPFYTLDTTSDEFYESICNKFEERVNKSSNPPSKKEWDDLNEYL